MIAGLNVITDNLDYLLGTLAAGEPGGVLLSLLMALAPPRWRCPRYCARAWPGALPGSCAKRSSCGQS
jgi:hypothetical protein